MRLVGPSMLRFEAVRTYQRVELELKQCQLTPAELHIELVEVQVLQQELPYCALKHKLHRWRYKRRVSNSIVTQTLPVTLCGRTFDNLFCRDSERHIVMSPLGLFR